MGEIVIEQLVQPTVGDQNAELVERKGKGHPDSICDGIANCASVALCEAYRRQFGRILHHNLDKMMLVAGRSSPRLGGGTIDVPMKLIIGDRGTSEQAGVRIDVADVVFNAAREWMGENLRCVNPNLHLILQNEIKAGSAQLTSLLRRRQIAANDTSTAIGFAPLSMTERTVLLVERYINSSEFKKLFPETGEDVKVMAFRHDRTLHLTIAVAFIDHFIGSRSLYFRRKSEITEHLAAYVRSVCDGFDGVEIEINTADDPDDENGMYLTVLGTSAEGSDSGQVGRGNRANGIISFNRPQSIEAHAGKNPLNHVGKIYSYFATHVARQLYSKINGVREVYVQLASQIGRPIDDPMASCLKFLLSDGASLSRVRKDAEDILSGELANVAGFSAELSRNTFYRSWDDYLASGK
jgi:S-adenosylmethionine synthetase